MKLHITANKLADFMTAKTPERRRSIVRQLKRASKDKGYAPFYTSLQTPAKAFLASGALDSTELLDLIERMKKRRGSKWKDIDRNVTTEAAKALIQLAPKIQALGVDFIVPPPEFKATLEFPDVDVIVTPNLIVHGARNDMPLIGALRFYFAKESYYQLGKQGAELVATMEYMWLTQNATADRVPDNNLCMVIECIQQRITAAPDDAFGRFSAIETACRDFAKLWNAIDNTDAA